MGLSPDLLALERPGRLDADKVIGFDRFEEESERRKEQPHQANDAEGVGQGPLLGRVDDE